MLRLILFLIAIAAVSAGLSWLADQPGSVVVSWLGYDIRTSVFYAIVLLAVFVVATLAVWSAVWRLWNAPGAISRHLAGRREKRGLTALSGGMIALHAEDAALAARYALEARKALPNEPLTHLLRAQAAQLAGDRISARRIFEAMLASPATEQAGLHGLYLEARKENELEAARQFAGRATRLNPKLRWAVEGLFEIECRRGNWAGALDTLALAQKAGHVSKTTAARRRAVLLTAQALRLEDRDPGRALNAALEAHKLAMDLVPAAALAGRLLSARGNTAQAMRVIERTWLRFPHPDLAAAAAHARPGDSPQDRLARVRKLANLTPNASESALAIAAAAIEARAFDDARAALAPLRTPGRLTQRVCLLMARIEDGQYGDKGRVREWLARAVNAPRDPVWTADGTVSEVWSPISPVTGTLDAFQWRVPVETVDEDDDALAGRVEELVSLGAPPPEPAPLIMAEKATGDSAEESSLAEREHLRALQSQPGPAPRSAPPAAAPHEETAAPAEAVPPQSSPSSPHDTSTPPGATSNSSAEAGSPRSISGVDSQASVEIEQNVSGADTLPGGEREPTPPGGGGEPALAAVAAASDVSFTPENAPPPPEQEDGVDAHRKRAAPPYIPSQEYASTAPAESRPDQTKENGLLGGSKPLPDPDYMPGRTGTIREY